MNKNTYRQRELQQFFTSHTDRINERENQMVIISKGVNCHKVCMSAHDYIKKYNLITYEEIKKKLGL